MRWLDDIADSKDMRLSRFRELVMNREAWCAAVHRVAKSWTHLEQVCSVQEHQVHRPWGRKARVSGDSQTSERQAGARSRLALKVNTWNLVFF